MKKLYLFILVVLITIQTSWALDGKTISHLVAIPIMEGAGVYTSLKMIKTDDNNLKAAAVTNISLMGINAGLGAIALFGNFDNYRNLRTAHRILGFTLSAASIWLTVSSAVNDDVRGIDKGIAAGYSIMTVVPLFMFSF